MIKQMDSCFEMSWRYEVLHPKLTYVFRLHCSVARIAGSEDFPKTIIKDVLMRVLLPRIASSFGSPPSPCRGLRDLTHALALCCLLWSASAYPIEPLIIGLSHPSTGNFKLEGGSQRRGAMLAVDEINAAGGVQGRPIKLLSHNSAGRAADAGLAIRQLVEQGAVMVMGSGSSLEARAAGEQARMLRVPYFVPIAFGNEVTGRFGHRYLFREGASARMANNVLMEYLETTYPDKSYFIITPDDVIENASSGGLAEASRLTETSSSQESSSFQHYRDALQRAARSDDDILVLMLYGNDVVRAMQQVAKLGLKKRMVIVVSNLNQDLVEQAGPSLMEGVIGADSWNKAVAEHDANSRAKHFVDDYVERYHAYPSSTAASAYGIVHQWADAVSRARGFDAEKVIQALENHRYSLLKDEQSWRSLDHQNVQSMYVIRVKPREQVMQDELHQDYFEVLHWMEAEVAAPTEKDILLERSFNDASALAR
jgi:ABC-type branched-subunit amino acid transport system substrate-binding protein